jgi:hypothetical protein
MLLAAEDGEGTCSLLQPGSATPGSDVVVEGISKNPENVLEFDHFKEVKMSVNEKLEAVYNDKKPLKSEKGIVISDKKIKKGAKIL